MVSDVMTINDHSMVRLNISGGMYVPVLYPYVLPTTSDESLDTSLKAVGYIAQSPSLKISGDKAVLRVGLMQVSNEMFTLLFHGCSGLVLEWLDDEADSYRLVVKHVHNMTRKLRLGWNDAVRVDIVCKLKATDYDFYTSAC